MVIVGYSFLNSKSSAVALNSVRSFVEKYGAKFLVLHPNASAVGSLDLGFQTESMLKERLKKEKLTIYNLGCDSFESCKESFVIYQGSHGDRGATSADLILPASCYLEEDGIFVNTEGRSQYARKAIQPPGQAKENWKIIRALSEKLDFDSIWSDIAGLRASLFKEFPLVSKPGNIIEVPWVNSEKQKKLISKEVLGGYLKDYYLSNAICRASKTMGELARSRSSLNEKIG